MNKSKGRNALASKKQVVKKVLWGITIEEGILSVPIRVSLEKLFHLFLFGIATYFYTVYSKEPILSIYTIWYITLAEEAIKLVFSK